MFQENLCKLVTKTVKDEDGITYEFNYYIHLSLDEKSLLKEFRENFAKTSPLHFNFDEDIFIFNQKKYFKKSQFIEDPPNLNNLESGFLNDIGLTLKQYKNFISYNQLENLEKSSEINLNDLVNRV